MKNIVHRFTRLVLSPLRASYQRRNGAVEASAHITLPNDKFLGMVREYVSDGQHSVTFYVKGVSMRPFLEGERDMVKLEHRDELHDYDAVLAEIAPGSFVLHRIVAIDGDKITLMGDGNVHGKEYCRRSDVVGVVTEYIRPRRTLLASDKVLQRRIRLWRCLLPIRRYLLFFYKSVL